MKVRLYDSITSLCSGISSETILKPCSVTEEELMELIYNLNTDHRVDGLLVQLPLPGPQGAGLRGAGGSEPGGEGGRVREIGRAHV